MRQIATLVVGEVLLGLALWFGIDWTLACGILGAQVIAVALLHNGGDQ